MGWKSDLAGQLKDDGSDDMSAAAGYEEGSEEEEPYEREFCDEDDEPQDVEHCDDLVPKEEEGSEEEPCDGAALPENGDDIDVEPFEVELCNEEGSGEDSFYAEPFIDEVEPGDDLVAHEEFVEKKSSAVQAFKKEQNKQELKRELRKGSCNKQKEVLVTDEMKMKPFKKRLSVKFAADVSCYTYSTESFAAAKLEKRKALFDDQDKHLSKRQEHTLSLPQDGGKPKEVDNTNLYVGNLPSSVASHKLIELFLPFGRIVRSRVVDDYFTGSSKRYGFVKYADPSCAAEAIKRMNGRLVEGRTLDVRVAGVSPSGYNPSIRTVSLSESDSQPSKAERIASEEREGLLQQIAGLEEERAWLIAVIGEKDRALGDASVAAWSSMETLESALSDIVVVVLPRTFGPDDLSSTLQRIGEASEVVLSAARGFGNHCSFVTTCIVSTTGAAYTLASWLPRGWSCLLGAG